MTVSTASWASRTERPRSVRKWLGDSDRTRVTLIAGSDLGTTGPDRGVCRCRRRAVGWRRRRVQKDNNGVMGRTYEAIDGRLADWLVAQPVG
jgi:hypothetical protein